MPYNARFLYQQPKTEINNYLIVNWFSLPLQTVEKHLVSKGETIGLWFLNHRLNIETDRIWAANIIFQLSVITTLLSIVQTPYVAAVTAHEKFNIYAYMSIYDAIAKLTILFLLIYIPGDKLIIYGALLAIVSTTSIMIYCSY